MKQVSNAVAPITVPTIEPKQQGRPAVIPLTGSRSWSNWTGTVGEYLNKRRILSGLRLDLPPVADPVELQKAVAAAVAEGRAIDAAFFEDYMGKLPKQSVTLKQLAEQHGEKYQVKLDDKDVRRFFREAAEKMIADLHAEETERRRAAMPIAQTGGHTVEIEGEDEEMTAGPSNDADTGDEEEDEETETE